MTDESDDVMMTRYCGFGCGESFTMHKNLLCVMEGALGSHETQCDNNPNKQEW